MMRYLTILTILLAATPARAQQGGDAMTDWFTVELIVFEQAGNRGTPPPDPYVPDTSRAVNLEEEFDQPGVAEGPARLLLPLPDAVRFLPAPPEAGTLESAWQRLERSASYRPVVRMAWRQRVGAFSNPIPVRVRGGEVIAHREADRAAPTLAEGGTLPAAGLSQGASGAREPRAVHEIDGTIALVRGRFLHVNADLVFRDSSTSLVTRGVSPAYGDRNALAAFPTWHITERREIQPGEVHYFDHPRFGVIVVATPWLAPEETDEAPASRTEPVTP